MKWLLNVVYEGGKKFFSEDGYRAKLKYYNDETQQIELYSDHTKHQPYLLTDVKPTSKHSEMRKFAIVRKHDRLLGESRTMYKIIGKSPMSIPALSEHFKSVWENKIKYTQCYLDDRKLTPGMAYLSELDSEYHQFQHDPQILQEIYSKAGSESEDFFKWLPHYLDVYLTPVPSVRRCAIDIEVEEEAADKVPNPKAAIQPIISAVIVSTDGQVERFVNKERKERPKKKPCHYVSEFNLIKKCLEICDTYPIVLTFNGDGFDLPYLRNRMKKLKRSSDPPLYRDNDNIVHFRNAIHVDLQLFLQQGAIQKYAFKGAYKSTSLEACSQALLKMGKIKHDGLVRDLSPDDLIYYNEMDAFLTLQLTMFGDEILLRLMFFAMRVNKCELMTVTRKGASVWLSSRFGWIHRNGNYLIPRKEDIKTLKGEASKLGKTGAKFSGAKVLDPIPGIYWDAVLVDFTSMYASIIKEYNISYETIKCGHEECTKTIPKLGYQMCSKVSGIIATHLSLDLTLRKNYFKPKSKQDKSFSPIEQFIKVEVNMSWGIIGHEHFDYYCEPAAEAITTTGQYNLVALRDEAMAPTHANSIPLNKLQQLTCRTLYGHTDSCMLEAPHELMIEHLKNFCVDALNIELDVEVRYRYVLLTSRRANYFGIETTKEGNKAVIKGLAGKKSNTPPLFQTAFKKVVKLLEQVHTPEDLSVQVEKVLKVIKYARKKIRTKTASTHDLSFNVSLSSELHKYGKSKPPHVKAALTLRDLGYEVHAGDTISYIKCRNKCYKPVEIADPTDIDTTKYLEQLESIFVPLLEPLQLDYNVAVNGQHTVI